MDVICHSAAPFKLTHEVLDILLVLNEAHVGQAKAAQFKWGIKDSLLHFAADAHLREYSILKDDRDLLALLHCESGERKRKSNCRKYPCCQ